MLWCPVPVSRGCWDLISLICTKEPGICQGGDMMLKTKSNSSPFLDRLVGVSKSYRSVIRACMEDSHQMASKFSTFY